MYLKVQGRRWVNMPQAFETCVAQGGRVRTKKLNSKQYLHICFKNGKSYAGEVRSYKKVLKGSK